MARQDTKGDRLYGAIIEGLIAHRKRTGMTQWDLARSVGTDQSQISKFERRERRLDVADYARMCEAMNLDPGLLLRNPSQQEEKGARRKRR